MIHCILDSDTRESATSHTVSITSESEPQKYCLLILCIGKLVETLVSVVKVRFPKAVLHFEDFGLQNAKSLLDKYRPQLACFNDDVQGTGVVTLAAINAAARIADLKFEDLRVLIFGAGSAGAGIADQFRDALKTVGKSEENAVDHIW